MKGFIRSLTALSLPCICLLLLVWCWLRLEPISLAGPFNFDPFLYLDLPVYPAIVVCMRIGMGWVISRLRIARSMILFGSAIATIVLIQMIRYRPWCEGVECPTADGWIPADDIFFFYFAGIAVATLLYGCYSLRATVSHHS